MCLLWFQSHQFLQHSHSIILGHLAASLLSPAPGRLRMYLPPPCGTETNLLIKGLFFQLFLSHLKFFTYFWSIIPYPCLICQGRENLASLFISPYFSPLSIPLSSSTFTPSLFISAGTPCPPVLLLCATAMLQAGTETLAVTDKQSGGWNSNSPSSQDDRKRRIGRLGSSHRTRIVGETSWWPAPGLWPHRRHQAKRAKEDSGCVFHSKRFYEAIERIEKESHWH